MSEQATPEDTAVAPDASVEAADKTQATEPPEASSADQGDGEIKLTSEQLKSRIDRAAKSAQSDMLKSLGVENVDDIKAAIAAKREQEEAQKTLEERLASERQQREAREAELAIYRETVSQQAQQALDGLSDEQRAAVTAIAGDDSAKQLSTLAALRPTWATARDEQPKPPPANTAPPRSQPNDSGNTSPTDHAAEYRRLRTDPAKQAEAALYMNLHSTAILAAQQQGG